MATKNMESILKRFADEIRAEARAELLAALAGGVAKGAPAAAARKIGRKRAAPVKREKRTPDALAKLSDSLLTYVMKHPGERVEQIAVGMGVTTKELRLPMLKLIAAGHVKTRGQKRATSYSAKV